LIPVSAIVTTYNEEKNLGRCLRSLKDFDQIIVVDSNSTDRTHDIAREYADHLEVFTWNGQYPKKRQWCLENLKIAHQYVFFVDGDEEITEELIEEIRKLDFSKAGYFVKGQYVWKDKPLKHGLVNNKLVLFDITKIEFPVVNDLDMKGMGEMEGHYQPILKPEYKGKTLGKIQNSLLHYAYEDRQGWYQRHQRYAAWEAAMIKRDAYPQDPNPQRETFKKIFRKIPIRPIIAFCHSYFVKVGFLDGWAGYEFAKSRYDYYILVKEYLSRQ